MIPNLVDMLRELVAIPSVSSSDARFDQSNKAVVERLAEWAEGLGFRCEVVAVPDDPRKVNLVATLGDGEGGLVLAGHTDTVPYDQGAWSSDPFALTERDGKLYGLGSADMKGALAAALDAARELRPGQLRAPLTLVATADEESDMAGARALAAAGRPQARHAVVGEPTSLRPVRKHKGITMEAIRLIGRSGHSSNPALGASALEGMREVMDALVEWRQGLAETNRDADFEVPTPTLNLGRIEGGDSPNRICARCELRIDLRPIPPMELEASRQQLRQRVRRCVEGSGLQVELESLFEGIPPFETPADAQVVRAAEELTGAPAHAVMFATECPFFRQLGMDAIVLGPGSIDVAHQPDEHVGVDELKRGAEIYRGLVQRLCIEGQPT